jgi:hypothetical protein
VCALTLQCMTGVLHERAPGDCMQPPPSSLVSSPAVFIEQCLYRAIRSCNCSGFMGSGATVLLSRTTQCERGRRMLWEALVPRAVVAWCMYLTHLYFT